MEKIRFQLNGVYIDKVTKKLVCPTSFSVGHLDRIYDPWAIEIKDAKGKVIDHEGDYVDIAYILREVPAPKDSSRDSIVDFGRVEFFRSGAGIIEIIGGQREMEKLLPVLFFHNRNSSNVGKPWFVKPNGKTVFHQIETAKKANTDLKSALKIDRAIAIITEMSDEEVNIAAAGLIPNRYNGLDLNERILALRKIANYAPEKILDLSKNVEVRTTAFIEECLKAGIINMDKTKNQFVWADDKTKICMIKTGITPHNSLKRYFMTDEGTEVLASLEKQLEISKQSKKEKTSTAVV